MSDHIHALMPARTEHWSRDTAQSARLQDFGPKHIETEASRISLCFLNDYVSSKMTPSWGQQEDGLENILSLAFLILYS
jgi:hypothetical protein